MTTQPEPHQPTYLYGFLRAPHPPLPALTGVFGAPVRTETAGDLSAIVSPLPRGQLRASRSDVLAHADVLQQLVVGYDVVPTAFGAVYADGFRIDELPRAQRRSLSGLLSALAERVEFQVKGRYDEAGVTRAIVDGDARLNRLRSARRQDHGTQLAIGSRFAELLDKRRRADTARVSKRLSRVAERLVADAPDREWGAFRLALLVPRAKTGTVERTLTDIAEEFGSVGTVTWLGPLPPYSFVQDKSGRKAG